MATPEDPRESCDEVALRMAAPGDCGALYQLHTTAVQVLAAGHYAAAQRDAWCRRLRPEGYHEPIRAGKILAAEKQGRLVGFGQLDSSGEIEAIYVAPDCARQGIGTLLLRELERRALATGHLTLALYASLNAVPFYEANGFVEVERSCYQLGEGVELECVRMLKRLR